MTKSRYMSKYGRKFRGVSDVIAQIRHDPRFFVRDYVVFYEDRFSSHLQSKSLVSFLEDRERGEIDVFVPLHRVRQIRDSKDRVLYDRDARVDHFKDADRLDADR